VTLAESRPAECNRRPFAPSSDEKENSGTPDSCAHVPPTVGSMRASRRASWSRY
jgi:hypothetical protein